MLHVIDAWGKADEESKKIVHNFIQEVTIPLMRSLFAAGANQRNVVDLINNPDLNLCAFMLTNKDLETHITKEVNLKCYASLGFELEDERVVKLLPSIKEKVFLELLNQNLLKTDFSLKDSSLGEAKKIADKIIEEEVKEFKLKDEKAVENQINSTIDSLLDLGWGRMQVCRRVLREYGYSDLDGGTSYWLCFFFKESKVKKQLI